MELTTLRRSRQRRRTTLQQTTSTMSPSDSGIATAAGPWLGYHCVAEPRCRGAKILDAACGTGASALPAAETVGPGGEVIAVDLAEKLLSLGRTKASAPGLVCLLI
jgi:2-polyprenyl-3-methyl-5-hydroxy-6-metoxy-1,4-benzoquinol methylase